MRDSSPVYIYIYRCIQSLNCSFWSPRKSQKLSKAPPRIKKPALSI